MIATKIWQRYILVEALKIFFLFMGSFYFMYVIIDYSSHAKYFGRASLNIVDIAQYYFFHFAKRADILVPFALMLANIKVLCSLNLNRELVAFQAGGLRLKKLLRPFLFLSLLGASALYINTEMLAPSSLTYLDDFEEAYFKSKDRTKRKHYVNEVHLQDGSKVIYKSYDFSKEAFMDVFWIRNSDNIYRIQELAPYEDIPEGSFVDHLQRDMSGSFVRSESFRTRAFEEIAFDPESLHAALVPPETQSLSQLWEHLPKKKKRLKDSEAEILAYFNYKAAMPLVCFLVLLGPAPFCIRFNRQLRVFPIFAISIFALITFFTLMDTALILGESQVLSPRWAIWAPFLLAFAGLGYRYTKVN